MKVSELKLIPTPKLNDVFRHYKKPEDKYQILGIAKDVNDGIKRVIYRNTQTLEVFSREEIEFRSYLIIDNQFVPRFTFLY